MSITASNFSAGTTVYTGMKRTPPHAAKLALTALVLAAVAGCGNMGGSRPPDPTTLRLQGLERRLEAIERILANGSLVDLTLQMDALQRQAAELQGRVESLEFEQSGTGDRQRALYSDLDERLQNLEDGLRQAASSGSIAGADGGESESFNPSGGDQETYQGAFEMLKEQRYEDAAEAFAGFLAAYPESQLADNAQYWLAEAHYVTDEFALALDEFQEVLDLYPRSRKVPDALLKIGYCNYELDNWPEARIALSRVRADFPDTTAARLAEQRLERMSDEGR